MEDYQSTRDRISSRLFEVSEDIASMRWSEAEIGTLLREMSSSADKELDMLSGLEPIESRALDWQGVRC